MGISIINPQSNLLVTTTSGVVSGCFDLVQQSP